MTSNPAQWNRCSPWALSHRTAGPAGVSPVCTDPVSSSSVLARMLRVIGCWLRWRGRIATPAVSLTHKAARVPRLCLGEPRVPHVPSESARKNPRSVDAYVDQSVVLVGQQWAHSDFSPRQKRNHEWPKALPVEVRQHRFRLFHGRGGQRWAASLSWVLWVRLADCLLNPDHACTPSLPDY